MTTHYLTCNNVQVLNEWFVGPDKLRDFGLLDSAVMRPQASAFGEDAYPTIHEKAAALLYGLARNHPFVDANKRTAWAATSVFYQMNGYDIAMDDGAVVALVVDIAEGQLDVPNIAAALKAWAQPFPVSDDWMGTTDDTEF
ncbi:type II toxin-antitoxin system death-on-curing family toxin [Mycobacterium shigaense]|uniref:type II toxin-antitoxin system death-on-curing family toxin n=1 Tax=Mycobacterium shigaense TaxID=722731 RepID=UPI002ADF0AC6|nr:type II toxin-antitoxin system death-on-curing family toxin [Mycobacterium shigaense]MEA1123899.1 type II toxin-antitoxin system death-on-curing family toxin [Mycobacterium shigaense]